MTLLILGSAAWLQPPRVPKPLARSCPDRPLSQQVSQADLIMTGTVFAVLPKDGAAEAIIVPDRIYRGQLTGPTVSVTVTPSVHGSTGGSVDPTSLDLSTSSKSYIFYLRRRVDDLYVTNRCAGTRLFGAGLSAAEATILGPGSAADQAGRTE